MKKGGKKIATILFLCFVLILSACSQKTTEPQKQEETKTETKKETTPVVEEKKETEETGNALYDQYVKQLALGFNLYDTGSFDTVHYDSLNDYDHYLTDYERVETDKYDFLRLNNHSFSEDEEFGDIYYGWLQKDGIDYSYYLTQLEDGSTKWVESVAKYSDKLPLYESIINIVPDYEYITSIEEGAGEKAAEIVYTIKVSPEYQMVLTDADSSEISDYVLSDLVITSVYDADVEFVKYTKWSYTESFTTAGIAVKSDSYIEVNVKSYDYGTVDTEWFKNNQTYVRSEYSDVTSTQREEHFNIPEKVIFDVRIPQVNPQLPGADTINAKIAEDCYLELTADEDYFNSLSLESYATRIADYEVYRFGNTYEICIFVSEGSADGSGSYSWMFRYIYDALGGKELTAEEFLTNLGYDKDSFIAKIDEIYPQSIYGSSSPSLMEYEELLEKFYVKENGDLYINMDFNL